jgi:tryptophan halogenase
MKDSRIKKIVIVGGGTAGWMTAAALSKKFGSNNFTEIVVVESEQLGSIGVGEATVPSMREFLRSVSISETDFVKRTNATFKLAIRFEGWAGDESSFFHPFADHGVPISGVPFTSIWTKMMNSGKGGDIDRFNLGSQLANQGRFALPKLQGGSRNALFNYAFHFDAALAAQYFRSKAEMYGAERIEGRIEKVAHDQASGFITAVTLESGKDVSGDFFIDCSGFKAILMDGALNVGYQSWKKWLPCDRAITVQSESDGTLPPYTRARACDAGWQWRIPLQNRVGNGYVYCSDYVTDDEALSELEGQLNGKAIATANQLRFETGIRSKFWEKNVYSIGLSAGFLEPLESTGIYFIQTGIRMLLSNFPSCNHNQALVDEVNRAQREHWEGARDFLILHYVLNRRVGEPFWDMCRNLSIPSELADNIELYKHTGRLRINSSDFFQRGSWVSMFCGFGIIPEYYHPGVDDIPFEDLEKELSNMSIGMRDAANQSLLHADFIEKNCAGE